MITLMMTKDKLAELRSRQRLFPKKPLDPKDRERLLKSRDDYFAKLAEEHESHRRRFRCIDHP